MRSRSMQPPRNIIMTATHAPAASVTGAARFGMILRQARSAFGGRQGVVAIRATGRGSHSRTRVNRSGFPVGCLMAEKCVRGFRTGDIARGTVPSGKRRGVHVGRVAVRRTGAFNVRTAKGTPHRHCRVVKCADGCGYVLETSRTEETATMHGTRKPAFLPALKDGLFCGMN